MTLKKAAAPSDGKSVKVEPGVTSAQASKLKHDLVRFKKLDTPVFSGNLRDYPNFKRNYETHMIPIHGKDPYALKGSLTGEALDLVQGLYDDFDEMIIRLDANTGVSQN